MGKRNMKKRYGFLFPFLLAGLLVSTQSQALPSIESLLHKIDEQENQIKDITARISLIQERPHQDPRPFEMLYYRRDRDNCFLLIMLSPSVEKGNGYLKVEDHFWLYRKNTRTFQHVNRDESIGGSDVKGGDLESRKYTELYRAQKDAQGKEKIEETMLGKYPVYVFSVEAKVENVTYPKQKIWLRKNPSLILKIENYSRSGTLLQTQFIPKYQKIEGKYLGVLGFNRDEFEKGNRTKFKISDISLKKIPVSVFTKNYLENLSR